MSSAAENSVNSDVLSLLKELNPGNLYLLTTKTTFLRGFQYYNDDRLKSFSWHENKTLLKGMILGSSLYTVSFSSRKNTLRYQCDCPAWTTSGQCKHIICGLLTILNLISSKLFHQPDPDENRLQALKTVLLREQEIMGVQAPSPRPRRTRSSPVKSNKNKKIKDNSYELVIESKGDYPSIFLRNGGIVVDSPRGLPNHLSSFTYRYYTDQSLRDRFFEHLTRFANKYPLIFEDDTQKLSLEWDPSLSHESKTELDVSGAQVNIHARVLKEGQMCKEILRFWDFVVDPKTKKLSRVTQLEGWRLFDDLDRLFRPAVPSFDYFDETEDPRNAEREWVIQNVHFIVSLSTFQTIQFNVSKSTLKETLKHLILKIEGKPETPIPSKHHYRITIDPGESETATLKTECWLDDLPGLPTAHTFRFFTDLHTLPLPIALQALKRLTVLYQCYFQLFPIKKEKQATQLIRKALSGEDFTQYTLKKEARDLLKHYYLTLKEEDLRLHVSQGRWFIVPNEKEEEALLYKIPFELFGVKIFKEMTTYHEIKLPRRQLYAQLSLLYAQCKTAGIELFHKGKPVKTVKWDFSFDARRPTGIDWFEIRPEIRSDGVLVDESVWQNLLQGRGIVEKDGAIQIVDSNAQKIINALALIYKSQKNETREKKEIVQIPRMQILDWVALRKEGVEIRLSDEDEALIKGLTQLEKVARIPPPRNLIATLRPYQKDGLDWLVFLYHHRFGAILADDMGLGKTLQAICLLAVLKEKIIPSIVQQKQPHLIVVPPTLLFNWEQELQRFYPKLKCYQYVGKNRSLDFKNMDIVLTTYALVRRDIQKLKTLDFHVIIFDEAQAVKNVYADTTGAVRQLRSAFKLVMTGTPLENHLGEYYSLIDLALPGLLGEYDQFKTQMKLEESPLLQVLIERTRPFVLRRIKSAVLKDLPPKIETDLYLDLTDVQKALYQQTVASISSKIHEAYREKTSGQARIIALTAIMKLRQLCVSPLLIDPEMGRHSNHSPKMDFLINQLCELHEEGHSALVFSQFTRALDLFENDLKSVRLPFYRLDGSTPTPKRKSLVENFQEGTAPSVFLLSLKAGGQGLNLTKASYVFHLDPWWNPAVENQASDRAHRIGQKQKVSITRILMRHTIEEKMMQLKKKKLELYDAVMSGTEKVGKTSSITKKDFEFLLGKIGEPV